MWSFLSARLSERIGRPAGTVHLRLALDGRRSILIAADPGAQRERLCMLAAYDQLAIGAGW